jgi:hypothetical protein
VNQDSGKSLDIVCNQVLVIKVLAGESVTLVGFFVSLSWLGFVQNYFEVCYRVFTKLEICSNLGPWNHLP